MIGVIDNLNDLSKKGNLLDHNKSMGRKDYNQDIKRMRRVRLVSPFLNSISLGLLYFSTAMLFWKQLLIALELSIVTKITVLFKVVAKHHFYILYQCQGDHMAIPEQITIAR